MEESGPRVIFLRHAENIGMELYKTMKIVSLVAPTISNIQRHAPMDFSWKSAHSSVMTQHGDYFAKLIALKKQLVTARMQTMPSRD